MSPGKVASQSGHAFLGAFLSTQTADPVLAASYAALSPGTKVCLSASLTKINSLVDKLEFFQIPHYIVIDEGCSNFYEGKPIITALGIAPLLRETSSKLLKGFPLYDLHNQGSTLGCINQTLAGV